MESRTVASPALRASNTFATAVIFFPVSTSDRTRSQPEHYYGADVAARAQPNRSRRGKSPCQEPLTLLPCGRRHQCQPPSDACDTEGIAGGRGRRGPLARLAHRCLNPRYLHRPHRGESTWHYYHADVPTALRLATRRGAAECSAARPPGQKRETLRAPRRVQSGPAPQRALPGVCFLAPVHARYFFLAAVQPGSFLAPCAWRTPRALPGVCFLTPVHARYFSWPQCMPDIFPGPNATRKFFGALRLAYA